VIVRVGARTDVGKVRTRNEDAYLVEEPLFAVADGMGGHRGGNVASALTIESIRDARPAWDPSGDPLVEAVRHANRVVHERAAGDHNLRGMGTTVTVLQTSDAVALIAHVGDSRAYLLRDGELRQLTHDHTLVQQMVDEGKISREEAGVHPARNIITRSLGVEEDVDVDEQQLDLHVGDRFLLCSDGLTGMLDDDEIGQLLGGEPDPQAAADALVDLAVERGGDDNVTTVVVDVQEGNPAAEASERAASEAPVAGDATTTAAMSAVATRTKPSDAKSVIERAEARAVAGPRPATAPPEPSRRPFRRRSLAAWIVVVAVVVVGTWVGVHAYVDRQWYVGVQDGNVAVYNGIPARPVGLQLSHAVSVSDVPAGAAERLEPWKGLAGGITVDNRAAADALVVQIRSDVAAASTPPATPAPTASP
jgi:protein phosphatase